MFGHLTKLFLFLSLSFAAMEGFGGQQNIETLYEKVLKQNYEKIAPLKAYAKKRQSAYIFSAFLALVVFALFVKYFKATGAVVALLMIAGGVYYLKTQTPAISPYKEKFSELVLQPIAMNCCGFRYEAGKISQEEIKKSKMFSPRIKFIDSSEGIYVKDGVKFGYVDIEFDTHENASVERFAENVFSGFVIILDRPNRNVGALVSDTLKQKVADIDPVFTAFFADMPRSGKKCGFELFGEVGQEIIDHCDKVQDMPISLSLQPDKTYIFLYEKSNPLDPDIYGAFTLKSAKKYEEVFKKIERIVELCR
jgi:hypothetical protein